MVLFSLTAKAEELVEKNVSVTSQEAEPAAAKKDLQEQAVEKVTMDLARELMGPERFEKSKGTIQNKILKLSGRYISYVKPGDLTQANPGYAMDFLMKVSPLNLKILLQNNGLMNENDTSPVVLPLISFNDRVGVSAYKWWQQGDVASKKFLVNQAKLVENSLRQAFKKQQFHMIRPMEMNAQNLLPNVFQNDRISGEDRDFIGNIFQAPLVVEGDIEYSKSTMGSNTYRIDIKLSAVQLSNNRPIADVSRKYETDSGNFESIVEKKMKQVIDSVAQDLAGQVYEAWQKGSVGTNVLRLTIRGDVPIRQRESLKEKIRTQIPQIKNIRERMVTSSSLSFEVDSTSTPQELSQKLSQLEFNGAKFQQSSANGSELVVDLKQ
jgi:hypothetical protein